MAQHKSVKRKLVFDQPQGDKMYLVDVTRQPTSGLKRPAGWGVMNTDAYTKTRKLGGSVSSADMEAEDALDGANAFAFASDDFEPDDVEMYYGDQNFFSQEEPGRFAGSRRRLPRQSTMSIKRSRSVAAPIAVTQNVNLATAKRVIYLSGREFIQDVPNSTTFFSTFKQLRPTDSQLFSWLSGIAVKFEEFKFLNLTFKYEPQCSSTTSGQVGMYFDGDPTHGQPATWNNFINTGANSHGASWAAQSLVVPRNLYASRRSYYTLNEFPDLSEVTNTAKPSDPLEYFPGVYGYVVEGGPAGAQTLGKIYLEYSIMLRTQNVEGYNVTSSTGNMISTEPASNSGCGAYYRLSTFALDYFTPNQTSSIKGGINYFKVISSGGTLHYVTSQDVELFVSSRLTAAAGQSFKAQGAPITNGTVGTYADLADTEATLNANGGQFVVVAIVQPAANDWVGRAMLRLRSGFAFKMVAGVVPVYADIMFAPFPYKLAPST